MVEPEVPILRNGNPDLEGEETTSANIGIVWTPEWRVLKGFTFGVDSWKITREGYVNLPSASETIEAWESGNPLPNTFVIFDPATDRLVQVGRTFQNVNEFDVRGIDFAIGYVYASDNLGTFNFDLGGTWFERYSFDGENLVGQATSDESNDGYLEWKASARLAWRYKGFHIAISPRYIDGFTDYTYDADFNVVERQVESRILTDVYMSYDIGSLSMIKAQEWLNDATVYVKIRNVLDTDPPYANGYFGNSVGYPGFLYDSRGRVITAGFELKF
ncbi:MAG: TonB-dependent receptor [Lentisphaerae bacterium]|nr:MAG: TonB-dependent receptor [Lentisphaerota bacterium]